jgi:hypothetical protein
MSYRPAVPHDDLAMQETGGDLIVYDSRNQRAHCLNSIAASVLRYSDGTRTVSEISSQLSCEQGLPENEALVWAALDELAKAGLLTEAVMAPPTLGASRRSLLRAAAITLPLIESILVPSPLAASSNP